MIEKFDWKDVSARDQIARMLKQGSVIIGDTDTVVGLFAPATQKGRDALDTIKQRVAMPYLVLVADLQQAAQLSDAFAFKKISTITDAWWPGPLTLIVPAKESVPAYMKSEKGGIAIRMPDHEGIRAVVQKTGPLFSTSANLSGNPVPETVAELSNDMLRHAAAVITDSHKKSVIPSTILDCTTDPITVIRKGALTENQLREHTSESIHE